MMYITVKSGAEAEYIEKKSRFIGFIAPVKTEEEALGAIAEIKRKHREANHNVYAYILRENGLKRFSDDGEPQGTAGRPVLEVIEREGITDVLVVVTRYFGGTLLGAGGLFRAYGKAAKMALDAAERAEMRDCVRLKITSDYSLYNKVGYILESYTKRLLDTAFGADVIIELIVYEEDAGRLKKELDDATNALVLIELVEKLNDSI